MYPLWRRYTFKNCKGWHGGADTVNTKWVTKEVGTSADGIDGDEGEGGGKGRQVLKKFAATFRCGAKCRVQVWWLCCQKDWGKGTTGCEGNLSNV